MDQEKILSIFRETGALLEGHFQLTSGLHSDRYFQCARVLQHPHYAEMLCGAIAGHFRNKPVNAVIAPALGGIVVGQETGRQLGCRTMFTERKDGSMQLRRGFEVTAGEQVLVCEDVVTTGGSVREVIDIVRSLGGTVTGIGYIVDRSGGRVSFDGLDPKNQYAVLRLEVRAFEPDECSGCRSGKPVVKPGSRTGRRVG